MTSLENSPTLMVEAANAIYASNAEPISELVTSQLNFEDD